MEIKIKLDNENYIKEFAAIGDLIGENTISVKLPEKFTHRQEVASMVWNEKQDKFIKDVVTEIYEEPTMFFNENYAFFKFENNIIRFDEIKKENTIKANELEKQEKIKIEIMELEKQKEFFKSKGWDTGRIESEIITLEQKLGDFNG